MPCEGFNPRKARPRPIHTLAVIFLLVEQLWEVGLKLHLHLSSSSEEAKARLGPEDRATTPECAVSMFPTPAMADGWFPTPQGWGAGTVKSKAPTDGKGKGLQGFSLHLQE